MIKRFVRSRLRVIVLFGTLCLCAYMLGQHLYSMGYRLDVQWYNTYERISPSRICSLHMLELFSTLEDYASMHGGKYPESSTVSESGSMPRWLRICLEDYLSRDAYPRAFMNSFVCPENDENVIIVTSYEFPFAGKSRNDIAPGEVAVLLREKDFPGSHHHVIYIDRTDGVWMRSESDQKPTTGVGFKRHSEATNRKTD